MFYQYGPLATPGDQSAGVCVSKGWTVDDCLFDEGGSAALGVRSDDVTVIRSTLRFAYYHALVAWGPANNAQSPTDAAFVGISGLRLVDLKIHGNRTSTEQIPGATASSVLKCLGTRGVVVDNCESYSNKGPGLWFDACNFGYHIKDSYFHDNLSMGSGFSPGYGIHLEISWYGRVSHCVFRNNAGPGVMISNTSGVEVDGSLFIGNPKSIELVNWTRGDQYPMRQINIHDNKFKGWTLVQSGAPAAAVYHAISYYGGTPEQFDVRVNNNTYDPSVVPTLARWLNNWDSTITGLRSKFGWEYGGQIASIPLP